MIGTDEEMGFRQALAKDPTDQTLRAIFADWLDDRHLPEARIARAAWRTLERYPNQPTELLIMARGYGRRYPGEYLGKVNQGWLLYFPPETLLYDGQGWRSDARGGYLIHRFWHQAGGWNQTPNGHLPRYHRDTEVDREGFAALFPIDWTDA
jgi:uncharacterized protein (TIGR02996 family)